ncbi:MBL fold metallo-hydrolase [Microlunatus endophyticus]|uniref:MBL fold metallo-hydrolase n=1 Tax=Microlunatus endophyticus TaxID=1716077 RepID=A0A917RZZ4_9ACTN|nr:MBL fold metallo-hydrolase [Microlunatus endophyticus]GGL47323.1 MBL fold metallo-hydrolase [Microlunatus endophyticus]
MAETTIEFYGGLGVIGGSKIMISTPYGRVLLDLGLDIPSGTDLFRSPVGTRTGHELADYLNTGQAPDLPGIYDPALLPLRGPRAAAVVDLGQPDPRPSAVFISHAHIDHDGMIGFVRPDLACYAHPTTVSIHRALRSAGLGPAGHAPTLQDAPPGRAVVVGDITVEPIAVDHDVPGACGFLITTPDGRIAYTGDINVHRGDASRDFADRAKGVDVLITETTMLSFDPLPLEPPGEQAVGDVVRDQLGRPGLQLISLYERDLDRCQTMINLAAQLGRVLVWPGQQAAFLQLMGLSGVVTWDDSRPQRPEHTEALANATTEVGPIRTVSLADVWAHPGAYLLQTDSRDDAGLLDLPIGEQTTWIHSQGEPLGPFMPDWQPFVDWLDHFGIERIEAGSSGHAGPAGLVDLVRRINPGVVFPIHGFRPEALVTALAQVIPVVPAIVPEAGRAYFVR